MKESKVLRIISYALVPFLLIGIILPIVYYAIYKEDNNIFSREYFDSEEFVKEYLYDLEYTKRQVVDVIYGHYENEIQDNEKNIVYLDNSQFNFLSRTKELYFITTYGSKVWTNIKLTSETDTYDELINYLNEKNTQNFKYVNLENNIINSNAENIKLYGIQETNEAKDKKYTVYIYPNSETYNNQVLYEYMEGSEYVEPIETNNRNQLKVISDEKLNELRQKNPGVNIYLDTEKNRIVYEYASNSFNVYSSYIPDFKGEEITANLGVILNNMSKYNNVIPFILPISSVLLLLIIIYLVISIGHEKGKEGIILNDFDKIPFEIIFFIDCILSIPLIICAEERFFYENYKLFVNLIIGMYFAYYVVIAINIDTIIKRIKAKKLLRTTWTGRICIWLWEKLKKIFNKIKKVISVVFDSWKLSRKVLVLFIGIIVLSIIVINLFGVFGICIDLGILIFLIYELIKYIGEYEKIEKHLKKMYDGERIEKLNKADFSKYFHNFIEYINDIQKGYDNAIQEGIKSERLKTELITNVSHDIKTPLTSIINYVDLLKQENIQNEKVNEYLNILDNKSQRLKKLTEDLVEASKASSGNVRLNIERINVKELLKQSLGEFEDKFNEKNLIIENNYPKEDLFINADNRYIYRVIENLFSNISKYALEGTRVYIDLKTENNKVNISIKNISKNKLNISEDELMQRFVRGDKSRTTEGSGLRFINISKFNEIAKRNF